MKGKCGVIAPRGMVSNPNWYVGHIDKGNWRWPVREFWIKRGGTGKTSGSGPSGYKTNPSYMLNRSLAERPGVAAFVKKKQEERVKAKATPIKVI